MIYNSTDSDFKQLSQKLTNNSKEALLESGTIARKFSYPEIVCGHLLYAIFLRQGSVGSNILLDMGIKRDLFDKVLAKNSPKLKNSPTSSISFSKDLKKVFAEAFAIAKEFGYPYVGTEHLAYSLINSHDAIIQEILFGLNSKNVPEKIVKSLRSILEPDTLANLSKMFNVPEIANIKNKQPDASATPFIDKFCINVNKEKSTLEEVIVGREMEIQRMIQTLGRKSKNNPLLLGDPGVGKTALVTGLAQCINSGDVPISLHKKRIMNLDVAQLIAGTSFRGEFENRLKEIIREAIASKDIILFIDEIHTIVGAGNIAGSLDLANIIKPALARGDFQLIGATTQSEYKKHIEKDSALERRFQTIQVNEPNRESATKILFGIRKYYEKFHNVSISDSAMNSAIDLSIRYIQGRFLPDKAIDVIDEAASLVRSKNNSSDFIQALKKLEENKNSILLEKEKYVSENNFEAAILLRESEKQVVAEIKTLHKKQAALEMKNKIAITYSDIVEVVAKITGIPVEKISEEAYPLKNNNRLINIKQALSAQIIGQDEAVKRITQTLLRSQAGIGNSDRPIGSFLFLGPTGVGKTLTAKILAKEFFGASDENQKKSLIRIDMSELMERHSVSSLIGSPAGYIGYGEGGNLTEKVRRNPYAVILFDEIEKAHPDVFNILLQILEDGTLTDAEGTQVSFKNTLVILTSNIGTSEFTNASRIGFASSEKNANNTDTATQSALEFESIKQKTLAELKRKMRPEILNRLDFILVFKPLNKIDLQKIALLEIQELQAKLQKQNIKLVFDKKLPAFIAEKSFAIEQGARLIRKNIQEFLEDPIAEMIVYDKVQNGKISVKIEKEKIKIA